MDCLKSFNFSASANSNFSPVNNIQGWTVGTNNYFVGNILLDSTINISGFKNINIHRIDLVGNVTCLPSASGSKVLVEDWGVTTVINGQMPIIGNNITASPNQWNLTNLD